MTVLSGYDGNGPATMLASPIFIVEEQNDVIEFEVFEIDARALRSRVGKDSYYILGSEKARWERLVSLDACQSVSRGLRRLRDRPILKDVLTFHPLEATGSH